MSESQGFLIPEEHRGFLVPATYVVIPPELNDMLIASIIWGFSLACVLFSGGVAWQQTQRAFKRNRGWNSYVVMIWAELAVSTIISVIGWLMIHGDIWPSFQLYFGILCLWVVQMQCILGIMVNRIALLMIDRRAASRLKWSVAGVIGLINLSVFIIWMPARLQISSEWVHVNEIWDRVEKGLFAVIDLALNIYFIHLVHSKLIANGLTKYMPLFKFNCAMVICSISLDIILIGSMSISNGFMYVQFHPCVYLLKLHIEMKMAELIRKIVSASEHGSNGNGNGYNLSGRRNTHGATNSSTNNGTKNRSAHDYLDTKTDIEAIAGEERCFSPNYNASATAAPQIEGRALGNGITRLVQTTITSRRRSADMDDESSQSSTRQLKDGEVDASKHYA